MMSRLDQVMGTLLETWNQRYTFRHERTEPRLSFEVSGFTLDVVEAAGEDEVALLFEEAGVKHRAECSVEEAPRIIEALLFSEEEEGE